MKTNSRHHREGQPHAKRIRLGVAEILQQQRQDQGADRRAQPDGKRKGPVEDRLAPALRQHLIIVDQVAHHGVDEDQVTAEGHPDKCHEDVSQCRGGQSRPSADGKPNAKMMASMSMLALSRARWLYFLLSHSQTGPVSAMKMISTP